MFMISILVIIVICYINEINYINNNISKLMLGDSLPYLYKNQLGIKNVEDITHNKWITLYITCNYTVDSFDSYSYCSYSYSYCSYSLTFGKFQRRLLVIGICCRWVWMRSSSFGISSTANPLSFLSVVSSSYLPSTCRRYCCCACCLFCFCWLVSGSLGYDTYCTWLLLFMIDVIYVCIERTYFRS